MWQVAISSPSIVSAGLFRSVFKSAQIVVCIYYARARIYCGHHPLCRPEFAVWWAVPLVVGRLASAAVYWPNNIRLQCSGLSRQASKLEVPTRINTERSISNLRQSGCNSHLGGNTVRYRYLRVSALIKLLIDILKREKLFRLKLRS